MQSQVSFTIDNDIKRQVLAKVKQEGITLKALLTHAMKSFAAGDLTFGLHTHTQDNEPEIEEIFFDDAKINDNARKIAALLR